MPRQVCAYGPKKSELRSDAQGGALCHWAARKSSRRAKKPMGSLVTPGRFGVGVRVGDVEGLAVGAEARGLAGEVSGGRRVRRVPRVQLGRVNGFVYFGLGVHDGFVW